MCPDFFYHQNLELCLLLGKLSFDLLSPATAPINVITPRNSPRLYLGDARENYKLNKILGNGWMNGRIDAYSSQITTSTMLDSRHG